jgi:hypothetical protein
MQQHARSGGLLRRVAPRNDVETHGRDLAAHFRASFAINVPLSESEGAGNAGRSMRPQPRMQNK